LFVRAISVTPEQNLNAVHALYSRRYEARSVCF